MAELTATDTLVLETLASAEPENAEPDAVPVFPGPERALDDLPPVAESTPELQVAAAEAEPEPAIAAQELEREPEPAPQPAAEPEPEPAIAAQEPAAEPQPVVVAEEPTPEPEPEPEPVISAQEAETPVAAEATGPEPEPEPVVSAQEAEPPVAPEATGPEPEPEPLVAAEVHTPEPEPEPVVAAEAPAAEPVAAEPWLQAEQPDAAAAEIHPAEHAPTPEPQPVAVDSAKATMLRWPGGTAPGNGARSTKTDTFDEATSIIPAWQHAAPADSKRTVSLQAVPIEQITAGAGFAALLTFESGPFAGRIVALPNQMVTVGRAPDNDIVVGDPATSGHHGRIELRNGFFWISDLGSTNGTMVNGEPVIDKQLTEGDMIAIGQNTMRFTLES
jgi:hypothetical protein